MSKSKGTPTNGDALSIFRLLKRHFDKGVPIRTLAFESGVSERTLYRAIRSFREDGLNGLKRSGRSDKGQRRKIPEEVRTAIEGLCLKTNKPTIAWVQRQVAEVCREKQLPIPSYSVVLDIYHKLDQRLKVLAHEGDAAYEQEFDPLLRREAERPNEMWQCDHKDLKIWAVDRSGRIGKVWITAILDDFSRVVPGYLLAVGAPNSMRISATLRQGIWIKEDDSFPVAGIPEVFYSDQGPDFTSTHIEQVAADLGMQLVNTIVFKPRGRGKIERFFRTLVQMFCPDQVSSKEKPKPLEEVQKDFQSWLDKYHNRVHTEIETTPLEKWCLIGFLPRLPESLDALDLMLMKVEGRRKMHRDGLRVFCQRYTHELLTESIGQEFDIRYDPRDLASIWVYGSGGALVCKADTAGIHPTRKETGELIEKRQSTKKRLKKELAEKVTAAAGFVTKASPPAANNPNQNSNSVVPTTKRLRKHFHERN
jgi:putative transposase